MKPKIRYVNYSVANNFGNYIEIHKDLKKYPKLLKYIKEHELEHSKISSSIEDFFHDIRPKFINGLKILKFMITRPNTWIQLSPVWIKRETLIYDPNRLIFYLFIISLITIISLIL